MPRFSALLAYLRGVQHGSKVTAGVTLKVLDLSPTPRVALMTFFLSAVLGVVTDTVLVFATSSSRLEDSALMTVLSDTQEPTTLKAPKDPKVYLTDRVQFWRI